MIGVLNDHRFWHEQQCQRLMPTCCTRYEAQRGHLGPCTIFAAHFTISASAAFVLFGIFFHSEPLT